MACFKFSRVPREEVDGRGQNSNSVSWSECRCVCALVRWQAWQVWSTPLRNFYRPQAPAYPASDRPRTGISPGGRKDRRGIFCTAEGGKGRMG